MTFGEHLTLDGYGGDPKKLNDKAVVEAFLADLPGHLDMHKLTEPSVVFAPENGDKDPGGWSGFVIIAESHISIHTFPNRKFVSADVYTCKNGLDVPAILAYFKETFALADIEDHLIKRGTRYPAHDLV